MKSKKNLKILNAGSCAANLRRQIPWLFPDQTPFFPDFNLTDFLTTHRFSLTLSTEFFFFVMLPQAKILPCGDEYGTLKRIDVKVTTCKFPDFKNIFSNQCFFPDFAAFLCLFPWLFFTFLRQHVNSLTFPWIPWFGGHPAWTPVIQISGWL